MGMSGEQNLHVGQLRQIEIAGVQGFSAHLSNGINASDRLSYYTHVQLLGLTALFLSSESLPRHIKGTVLWWGCNSIKDHRYQLE